MKMNLITLMYSSGDYDIETQIMKDTIIGVSRHEYAGVSYNVFVSGLSYSLSVNKESYYRVLHMLENRK